MIFITFKACDKKTTSQFCHVIFIKKIAKSVISLLFSCHTGNQVFTYHLYFFFIEYHELRFKGKRLCQSLFLNEVLSTKTMAIQKLNRMWIGGKRLQFYLIFALRERNQTQFELSSEIFQLFDGM